MREPLAIIRVSVYNNNSIITEAYYELLERFSNSG